MDHDGPGTVIGGESSPHCALLSPDAPASHGRARPTRTPRSATRSARPMKPLLLIAALCFGATSTGDPMEAHLLRLSPGGGERWYRVKQEMSYGGSDADAGAVQRMRLELFWGVESSLEEAGAIRVRERLDRLRIADTGAGSGRRTVSSTHDSMDSDDPPGPLRSYFALLDGETSWLVDERGAVTERSLAASWKQQDDRMPSSELRRSRLLRTRDLELPESPVRVGERWRRADPTPGAHGGAFRVDAEFTLVSVANGRATIREDVERLPVGQDGAPVAHPETGTRAVHTYTLDIEAGRVVATKSFIVVRTSLRGRTVDLCVRRESLALDGPQRGPMEPLESPSLKGRWDANVPLDWR